MLTVSFEITQSLTMYIGIEIIQVLKISKILCNHVPSLRLSSLTRSFTVLLCYYLHFRFYLSCLVALYSFKSIDWFLYDGEHWSLMD